MDVGYVTSKPVTSATPVKKPAASEPKPEISAKVKSELAVTFKNRPDFSDRAR